MDRLAVAQHDSAPGEAIVLTQVGLSPIEHSIRAHFDGFAQVQEIYVEDGQPTCHVWIMLDQQQYDDRLMDRLLDQEIQILDLFPARLFDFKYLPLLAGRSKPPVPQYAALVLRR